MSDRPAEGGPRPSRDRGSTSDPGVAGATDRAVPYLAGAGGAVVAAVLAISGWMTLVMVVESIRGRGIPDEAMGQVALILAVTALVSSAAAYVGGIPLAMGIEWALRKASAGAGVGLRYVAYLIAGLAGGGLVGAAISTTAAEALPMAALGGGAAVVGAATMRLARRRPRLGRGVAIAVPAGLVTVGLLLPAG